MAIKFLLLTLFSLLFSTLALGSANGCCNDNTLTSLGTALISAQPDSARFSLSISISGNSSEQISTQIQSITAQVLLKLTSYPQTKGEVSSLSIYSSSGYLNIDITTIDTQSGLSNKLTNLLKDLLQINGTSVYSITYDIVDKLSALNSLRSQAYSNAYLKAISLSSLSKRSLGGVLSITDQTTYDAFNSYSKTVVTVNPSESSSITPVNIEIKYQITVVFALA